MEKERIIAVLGQGIIGMTLVKLLLKSEYKESTIIIFSHTSTVLEIENKVFVTQLYSEMEKYHVDVIFSCTDEVSAKEIQELHQTTLFIDNSPAFRKDPLVPLIAAKGNEEDIFDVKNVASNPNCVTIMLARALYGLNQDNRIEKIIVTSLQSISGMGSGALENFLLERDDDIYLEGAVRKRFKGANGEISLYNNIYPLVGKIDNSLFSEEELKIRFELRKIFHNVELEVNVTSIRVPVTIGHSATVHVTFKDKISLEKVKKVLLQNKNIILEEVSSLHESIESNKIIISRLRSDFDCEFAINFFVTSDNLLVGAALNSLEIYRLMKRKD